jgi:hypothetical protein
MGRKCKARTLSILVIVSFVACLGSRVSWAQGYLFNRASFPAGSQPAAVIVADFNGDGRLDLAVANDIDNTVSILLGTPGAAFGPQTTYPVGSNPTGLVAADFNGDGKLDLAIMDSCGSCTVSPNMVTILLGNGDGTFQVSGNYATGGGPIGIVAADFNGDGKLDLALANQVDSTVSILLGNGDGTFQSQTTVAVGTTPYWLAMGDLNKDGRMDLVTLNIGAGSVSVLLSNGKGAFTRVDSPSGSPSGPSLGALALGDFNSDGKLDVVVGVNGSPLYLLLGNDDGSFQTPAAIQNSMPEGSPFVAAADFNHDGKLDLAEAEAGSGTLVLLDNGDGTFQNPLASPVGQGGRSPANAIADLNGDGALDFISADANLDTVDIVLGNGNGTFGVLTDIGLAPDINGPDAGAVADFNGDGKLDLAVTEIGFPNGQVSVQLGNGDGTFQQPVVSPLTIEALDDDPMHVADFDGDGKMDLVMMDDYAAGFEVLLGNGDGSFQPAVNTPVSPRILSLAVGDFNGDGKADVVITTNGSAAVGSLNIYLGNGDGTFRAGAQYNVPLYSYVVAGDVNDDGKPDLIVTGGSALQVFLGKGDGTFQAPISGPTAFVSGSAILSDFNGDGKPDIAVGSFEGIAWLAGNGDGTFQAPVYSACGSPTCTGSTGLSFEYTGRMKVGDFNGDGKLDVATYAPVDTSLGGAVIVIGNGDGTFQEPYPYSTNGGQVDLLAGDFNSDGISDLAIPNRGSNGPAVTLFLSGPTLDFFPSPLTFGTQNSGTISSPQTFTLTNLGPATLSLNSVTASGQFSQTNNCGTGLNKTDSCSTSVTFNPTGNGLQNSAIDFSDNFASGVQAVPLTGTGYGPFVTLSPTTLTFASQSVGSSSSAQAVSLTNQGPGVLTPTIQTAGDFNQTNNCGSFLAAGTSCVINVTFKPTSAGTRTGTITFVDNASGSPQSVSLSGIGVVNFGLALANGASGSITVAAGSTATYHLTIGGTGFAGTVDLKCSGAPATGSTCTVPANITLSPTTSSAFTVAVTTTSRMAAAKSSGHRDWLWAFAVFGFVCLPTSRKKRAARWLRGATLLLLSFLCSCGGSSGPQTNPNGTPAGQYSLTVTASAGSSTQSLALKLTVQ